MRGSPLLRFLLLAVGLVATAVGLSRVTSAKLEMEVSAPPPSNVVATSSGVPFQLQLSAPATLVEIDTGRVTRPDPAQSPMSGSLPMDPRNPHISLVVRWKTAATPGEHRFAKLTLEAPGQETFTHVFDADGDIDDFLELPLPVAK